MDALELKVPPPVVALCLALAMWLTSRVTPTLAWSLEFRVAAAIVLLCIGQGIAMAGARAFKRAKTTINPMKADKASSLVRGGVFRYTRNPMYLGLAITLLGWCLYLACPGALAWLVVYVLYIHRFQIAPEERILRSLFGAEYEHYMKEVRRWL